MARHAPGRQFCLVYRQHRYHLAAVPHRGSLNIRAGQLPRMLFARIAFPHVVTVGGGESLGD
jgi:hypothetical protein